MRDVHLELHDALEDRYRVEREIGRGGMAIVFLAQDLKHRRRVALKVLKPDLAHGIGSERFLREIELAARLVHPNILPIHDSDERAGFLYYVMPYVEGESLRDRLVRETQLPIDDAIAIIRDVADALTYAHSAGVVHRDIKPENILLSSGHALVSDFGIARAIDAAATDRVTGTGIAVGTAAYMSPEQASGDGMVDGRIDIYSLGCVAYELLAGQPPFSGANTASLLARHAVDRVPSLRAVRPSVPHPVERTIERALAKVPADRFTTANDFARALLQPSTDAAMPSVAVLPFAHLGGDPADEPFADGMTEDVIAQLSQIRALKVISRTSVMAFKKRDLSLQDIARQLSVGTLVEGSVRRSADRVRIVAQLIDAATDRHLWSETYDRQLTDVFAIQSDVAVRIAKALAAELSPDEKTRLAEHGSAGRRPHPEAYEDYLRGRFHWNQHTPEGFQTALRYFDRALEKDPDFSLAHGSIADVWGASAFVGVVPPSVVYANAKSRVTKALELDPTAPQNHDFLGRMRHWFEWDWQGAERCYRRAIELNANYADARIFYAWLLDAMQRRDEARMQMETAITLDPLNPFFHWYRGLSLYFEREFEPAVRQFEHWLKLDPGVVLAHVGLWSAFHQMRRFEEAATHAQRYLSAMQLNDAAHAVSATSSRDGYTEAMREGAAALEGRPTEQYVPPTLMARLYAYAGERDQALHWLAEAFAGRDFPLVYSRVDPTWDDVRGDARFQGIIRDMAFPPN